MANEIEDLVAESKSLIRSHASQLQAAYDDAYNSNSPDTIQAICQEVSMEIAGKLARDGWIIRRTSLDVLNKKNSPDVTEVKVLNNFITRHSEGKDTETLSWYKLKEAGNQSEFRYIKAFMMEQRCMTCHIQQQTSAGSLPAIYAYTLARFETKNYFPDPVPQGQRESLPTYAE